MLLIPVPQRILLVILFLEIRLFLRSLKPYDHFPRYPTQSLIADARDRTQWLSRVISWTLSSEEDLEAAQNNTSLILETLNEIYNALKRWSLVSQKVKPPPLLVTLHTDFAQRKSASLLSPSASVDGTSLAAGTPTTTSSPILSYSTQERQLKEVSKGLKANSLRLLVAVSGLLSREDHESLCAFLWQSCLIQAPCEIQTLVGSYCIGICRIDLQFVLATQATFLIMQCAENAPTAIQDLMRTDIRRSAFGTLLLCQ